MGKRNINRREFLGQASCAALGSTAFLSSVLNMGLINTLAARPHILQNSGDYKAIVCVLLAGGADTHNLLVPTNQTDYDAYALTRGNLALDKNNPAELLELGINNNGKTFGVHGGMTRVHDLFTQDKLSFISNIGTLIEPIASKSEYESNLKKLPLGMYSHSDQIMHWQTSVPQSRSAVGFGGRMADILHDMNTIPNVSMNISLDGKNRFQTGRDYNEYSISNNTDESNVGFKGLPYWWSDAGAKNDIKDGALNSMVEQQYSNIFHETIGALTKQTSESIEVFQNAFANVIPLSTEFSDTNISQDLKKMAEVISVRSKLGANRQIFFTSYGGWDHHDNVKSSQNAMLPQLSNALGEFQESLEEINMADDVITITISDFARTLTSNGTGSDHAWGGNQIIMGNAINGGRVFGDYPSLALDGNPLNVSNRGRIIPQISVDELYAELALWYGASPNDLDYILPNLCNFYSTSGCPSTLPQNYGPIGLFA
ncbi:DUF1501 domain-containing protein [Portibacter lacus]|uniref:DUF1501 domain-containing protein n=1 Tax=Portibacter lacus TaxID=1099794 RepID=A0AA37SNL2_9BACT|nr:DUF1501 domain-containing protein [Portibacter lacus]GLR17162.1 hypothetical protein GCM10007940_17770 [Portibacter lacus]